jgi:hypothetical protein
VRFFVIGSQAQNNQFAHLALENGYIVHRSISSKQALSVDARIVTNGLTITPLAQSFSVGSTPLSGGGWNAPQYGYSATYLDSVLITALKRAARSGSLDSNGP